MHIIAQSTEVLIVESSADTCEASEDKIFQTRCSSVELRVRSQCVELQIDRVTPQSSVHYTAARTQCHTPVLENKQPLGLMPEPYERSQ